ncbi:Short-chain dehydrogenase/reductase SDR [metagenome]|uniref:Short-chain dehydrogenase/reductase SDR n=1 Tax=metagenome TaxID=256318 RepID=A0A2P2CBR4_9ZZZZ
MGLCDGRVVIVTGGGRGIGRGEALAFAREGASVVVNDIGAARDGTGEDLTPAKEVAEEINDLGGLAIANTDDISDYEGAGRVVQAAIDHFGGLDVVVNNAGIIRDRMLVNMSIDEWDAVIRVHLRGTFCVTRHAASYWRDRSKAGDDVDARIINTSSSSGIYGAVGQSNYGAAKAGIAAFTVISAMELARYGVTANAIAPFAKTRMTEDLTYLPEGDGALDPIDPAHAAPLVVWLGSTQSRAVTGRVFNIHGGELNIAEGWVAGPSEKRESAWDASEFSEIIPRLLADARPNSDASGQPLYS